MVASDLEKKIEKLEKRVRELEDLEEIKMMHREYLFYISNLEFEKALDCFTDDIVTDVANYGIQHGKEEVKKFFMEKIYKNVQTSKDAHFTGQAVIELDGDKAKGHWMFYRFLGHPAAQNWVQGRYDCEYARVDGKWKFSLLRMKRPWPAFFAEKTVK